MSVSRGVEFGQGMTGLCTLWTASHRTYQRRYRNTSAAKPYEESTSNWNGGGTLCAPPPQPHPHPVSNRPVFCTLCTVKCHPLSLPVYMLRSGPGGQLLCGRMQRVSTAVWNWAALCCEIEIPNFSIKHERESINCQKTPQKLFPWLRNLLELLSYLLKKIIISWGNSIAVWFVWYH